jgi:hypothetical protein
VSPGLTRGYSGMSVMEQVCRSRMETLAWENPTQSSRPQDIVGRPLWNDLCGEMGHK